MLVTDWPLNRTEDGYDGATVSNWPPGVICNTSEPTEFELTLATAMRYVITGLGIETDMCRLKLRYAAARRHHLPKSDKVEPV